MTFRLALLTGASGGLGKALSKRLSEENIPLLLTSRNSDIRCDLLSREPLLQIIREQAPDLVINNAGFGLYGDALSHPIKKQLEILEVNGNAALEITLEAAQALKKRKQSGVILNIASAAAPFSFPGLAVYAAAKAFISQVSRSLDAELRPHNIRVLTALPGQIDTPFATRAAGHPLPTLPHSLDPDKVADSLWRQIVARKPHQIIDWRYKLSLLISRLLPQHLVEQYLYREILSRCK